MGNDRAGTKTTGWVGNNRTGAKTTGWRWETTRWEQKPQGGVPCHFGLARTLYTIFLPVHFPWWQGVGSWWSLELCVSLVSWRHTLWMPPAAGGLWTHLKHKWFCDNVSQSICVKLAIEMTTHKYWSKDFKTKGRKVHCSITMDTICLIKMLIMDIPALWLAQNTHAFCLIQNVDAWW